MEIKKDKNGKSIRTKTEIPYNDVLQEKEALENAEAAAAEYDAKKKR